MNWRELILMTLLLAEKKVYTVLDLEDAFLSLLLAEVSQPVFAFKWTDPVRGYSGQHTWTRFSQDLKLLNADFLCFKRLLQELQTLGYKKKSSKKAQFCRRLPILATS